RLGFILGSPVLYLKEGTRTIEINLDCYLDETLCNEIAFASGGSKDCCTESGESGVAGDNNTYPNFYQVHNFFTEVSTSLSSTYYYFNQDTLKQAIKKGIKSELVERLRENFLLIKNTNFDPGKPLDYCTNCPAPKYRYEGLLNENQYLAAFSNEKEILAEWIKPVKPLSILFSGEKDWIEPVVGKPGDPANLFISPGILSFTNNKFRFTLTIKAVLTPDKPAVTFYDKNNLKEDFDTTQPVVKIELDDRIKLIDLPLKPKASQQGTDEGCCVQSEDCCFLKSEQEDLHVVSLYHFFRNVLIDINTPPAEVIKVAVCGLKNFIVQNDESLQDVNGPVYPFGVRPVIDANFYIGSPEIFSKNWQNIQINHNWKDKPAISFEEYYTAYQHMFIDPNDINNKTIEGIIKDNNYKASIAILDDGTWYDDGIITCDETGVNDDNLLFRLINEGPDLCLDTALIFAFAYKLARSDFATLPSNKKGINCTSIKKLNADTRSCFLRITLKCQNFQHDRYAFILSRQMMAFGRLPADLLAGAYYRVNPANAIIVFNSVGALAGDLDLDITTLQTNAGNTKTQTAQTITEAHGAGGTGAGSPVDLEAHQADSAAQTTVGSAQDVRDSFDELTLNIPFLPFLTPSNRTKLEAVIPNEPWTPIISNMSIDYTASATLEDIDLIHLYPYAGTYKHEEIELQPTLFPTFCDEGTLFLGLKNLIPGNNLNMLFQLAEATSDSESEKEEVQWHYLDSNVWKPLRKGFEVLDDASENLTTSGIVKFAMPANMTKDNTIMPKDLHWIKASIAQNSKAVSETTGIHPQAIRVTFTNDEANDKLRLSDPLAAGSISKLNVADANVKSVKQPYETFDGSIPEIEQQFYVRVSELLRHKGRAIQKFDYERLTLEAFPQLFKAKCINHSFALDAHLYKNDFPYAPGYIILAVIPDLYKLKAGNSFEPKVPVSIIEKIETYIRKRTSPFVRFRAMNPRYEKINFCLRVKLIQGKDENYYREKLKLDMKELLAPWAVGKYDKLTFGQCVFRSDIIRFLESTDYVDFINDFRMGKEGADPDDKVSKICPDTPRSILIAGNIEVCIDQPECEDWKFCSLDNNNQIKIDCCTTPLIPVADYCIDKNEMIG
ncbi:MAG: hypothetical protein ABI419_05850, partial [Ginsengibacter sp.]